jgi:beta-lactamase superfamily II metal-dependent hydrolase
MKGLIKASFRFNKVGQGCFYSGFLTHIKSKESYSIVYDCGVEGSKQYINNEINKFHVALKLKSNGRIDLLIISHFDSDHVNKIKDLIDGASSIGKIVLPYLTPAERLMVYLANTNEDGDSNDNYRSFMIDPIAFLLGANANIEEILYITGGDDTEGDLNNAIIDAPLLANESNVFTVDYSELKVEGNEPEIKTNDNISDVRVRILKDKGRLKIIAIWEFYFFNRKVDKVKLDSFINCVKNKCPDLLRVGNLTITELSELFKNTAIIKDCYKVIVSKIDINNTSLIVYHAPLYDSLNEKNNIWYRKQNIWFYKKYKTINFPGKLSTLLTGDINTVGLTFSNYIVKNGDKISVLQIPHHGAERGWDIVSLKSIIKHNVYAIINFGLGNVYGHPKQKVIDDIIIEGWKIKLNHQLKSFKYTGNFRFKTR